MLPIWPASKLKLGSPGELGANTQARSSHLVASERTRHGVHDSIVSGFDATWRHCVQHEVPVRFGAMHV